MVSSLNQVTGGYGKMIGASQKLGLVNEEQFKKLEQSRAAMEMIAGPMEIFIALKKLSVAMETADTSAKGANTAATGAATTSTWGFNTALLANPLVLFVAAIIILVVALVQLERKFGLVTSTVGRLGDLFKMLQNKVDGLVDSFKGITSAAAELGDALSFGPVGAVMNILGGR